MIEKFGISRRDGRKTKIRCHWCPKIMRAEPVRKFNRQTGEWMDCYSWQIDRWPKCGHDGGTYRRGNIVPACPKCNETRCTKMGKKCRGRAPLTKKIFSKLPSTYAIPF